SRGASVFRKATKSRGVVRVDEERVVAVLEEAVPISIKPLPFGGDVVSPGPSGQGKVAAAGDPGVNEVGQEILMAPLDVAVVKVCVATVSVKVDDEFDIGNIGSNSPVEADEFPEIVMVKGKMLCHEQEAEEDDEIDPDGAMRCEKGQMDVWRDGEDGPIRRGGGGGGGGGGVV
ncbi:hypothetical protein N0V92_000159, partial [Colletotrichum tropicale]